MRGRSAAMAMVLAVVAGCSSGPEDSTAGTAVHSSTVAPSEHPSDSGVPTDSAQSTSTELLPTVPEPPATTPPAEIEPAVQMLAADPCRWPATPPDSAELTFVADGRLWSADLAEPATAHCLGELPGASAVGLQWSRPGDQLLVDTSTVQRSDGPVPTGFDAAAASIRWSMPTGARTVAVVDGRLHKIAVATGEITDVTFLDRHERVAYHPAGQHIVSTGTDESGQFGIFLADNEGRDARVIVRGESEPVITDLAFGPTGDLLYFVARHDGHDHLHQLFMDELVLTTVAEDHRPMGQLVVDPASDAAAVRLGDCSTPTSVLTSTGTPPIAAPTGFSTPWLDPIGWSDGGLVMAARTGGCSGPADLYLLDSASVAFGEWHPQLLVRGVEWMTVRSPALEPRALNTEAMPIESQAPA